MLELLEPAPGEKILDVGSGSGWTTTLLAHIVGERGKVIAIERVTELRDMGEANCARYNFVERGIARFVAGDGTKGFSAEAPFDAIHAAAAAFRDIPAAWKVEVKAGGRIVAPIGPSVWKFVKQGDGTFAAQEYYGFSFVPLVEE
jgi:protein-L-isoaspartate(D-aspartate) O-methyltransferase